MPDQKVRNGQPPCGRRNKTCRNCKYRYPKASDAVECPKCGETRFCQSAKVHGLDTCRMHGDNKEAHKSEPKLILGPNLTEKVNRILRHPELFELANEIALNESRLEQLGAAVDKFSYVNWGQAMDKQIETAYQAAKFGKREIVLLTLEEIRELRKEELAHLFAWAEMREVMKLHALLVKERHNMMMETEQTIAITQLVEVIAAVQRVIFKVVRNPEDRKYVMQELRGYYADKPE